MDIETLTTLDDPDEHETTTRRLNTVELGPSPLSAFLLTRFPFLARLLALYFRPSSFFSQSKAMPLLILSWNTSKALHIGYYTSPPLTYESANNLSSAFSTL